MENKDGYEKELNLHIERERAAVKLQSKVGELLYDKGIELVLFRNHLTDITISEILNLHEYAKQVVNKPIDVFTTAALAETSVWKVSKGSDYLYVAGTVHLLPESAFPLPAEFATAYKDTDTLVLETKIPEPTDTALQTAMLK